MKHAVLAVDVREAARLLGLSPNTVSALVSRKLLPSRKVGRRRIIPVRALDQFLQQEPTSFAEEPDELIDQSGSEI